MADINNLGNYIDDYASAKAELDRQKIAVDAINTDIKKVMRDNNLDTFSTTKNSATLVVQHRDSINEDRMLSILISSGVNIEGLIKTKEYIDMEVLESAIYSGNIPNEILEKLNTCRETKEVVTLRIGKPRRD